MSDQQASRPRYRRYHPLLVLSYILRYQQQHNNASPSQRRIQRDLGISAPSVVHNILYRLEVSDLLRITTYGRGYPASLTVTEAGHAAVQQWQRQQARDHEPPAA